MRHAQARPGPLDSLFDQPGTDGIAQHITQDGQEVVILLKGKTFQTPLSHMPMTPVVPMVAAGMTGHPPLHEAAQCSDCGRLYHQVKMIWYQTEGKHVDWMLGFRRGEQVEESVVGDLTARNTWHEGLK